MCAGESVGMVKDGHTSVFLPQYQRLTLAHRHTPPSSSHSSLTSSPSHSLILTLLPHILTPSPSPPSYSSLTSSHPHLPPPQYQRLTLALAALSSV